MRRITYSTLLFLLLSLSAVAQNGGINFQGMARNTAGEALANQKISLRLSVLVNSESGTVEYSETKEATTSGQGVFSVVIGDGNMLTKTGNFSDINWKNPVKFLKVELDPSGGTNFALIGTSRLQAVPFAYYANGVDAENIQGTLPVAKGGTGVGSITALKTSLGLDQVNNTSDANKPLSTATQTALETKVDKVTGKGLSENDYTSAEKSKLAAITGTNTGDQDLSGYASTAALATKANTADVTTALATKATASEVTSGLAGKVDKVTGKELSSNDYSTAEKNKLAGITGTNTGDQDLSGYATTAALAGKANTADVTTALATKATASEVTTGLAGKVDIVTGKELSTNDYSTAEKNKLAAITGTNTGDQDLSGYTTTAQLATKANTADVTTALATKATASDVTTGLAEKENASNKSNASDLGGVSPSEVLFPTQKAVKDYVTANASSGGVADGGITTIKLADGAVTDAKLASGINKSKVGLSNVENTALSTWTGSNRITSVGTISSGTWSGTAVAIEKGGTGLTSAGTAGQVLTSTGSGTLIWKSTTPLLSIGDVYQGGKVAYILQPGDPGFDATIQKGIIAASDQSTGIGWYNGSDASSTGATGTAIGTGLSNTNSIITSQGSISTSYAAGLARAYAGGGYTDWYLPSKDELNKLYENRTAIGGFADYYYWSSSEYDNSKAWIQSFGSGDQDFFNKSSTFYVRAIRAFSAVKSIEDGGTGATTASAARTNLGLVIGTNVQAPLIAGTDYQTPLTAGTNYIVPNSAIAPATKTKLTYDSKGLVTAGADATTADIAASSNKNYVTDAEKTVLGNTSGTNTGDQTSVSGNAGTATKLATTRNINDVPFDGTANITVTADAGTLTGTTLKSTVTGSSLTSVGTLANLTVTNPIVGSITGNAATATSATTAITAGNITATSNSTLTTLSNLTSVGTLTSATVNGKVIVGASSAASASAVLEANSTTKGFLPPRMTYVQRNSISSPAAGLVLWCTNCRCSNCDSAGELQVYNGSQWTNLIGSPSSIPLELVVGQSAFGGKVVYILIPGDLGYDENAQHGLIASTSDQSTGIQWYNNFFTNTGAIGTAVGTGLANTNTIIDSQGAPVSSSYAARIARDHNGGGYTDWYLPSRDELNKLYLNRNVLGMLGEIYWSSSESNNINAWGQWVNNSNYQGSQGLGIKQNTYHVRAVRSF